MHTFIDNDAKSFSIRKLCHDDICNSHSKKQHRHAISCWIATTMKDQISPSTTPLEIKLAIQRDFGVDIRYFLSKKGKELALEEI